MQLSKLCLCAMPLLSILLGTGAAYSQVMFDVRPREEMLETGNPESIELYNRAISLCSAHHEVEALPILKKVIDHDPKFSMAYYAYGLALQKTGQTKDAIVWLKKFTEMSPREASGWEALSGCYQQLGDLQGVLTTYKSLIKLLHGKRAAELEKHIKFLEAQLADAANNNADPNTPDYLDDMERVGLVRWPPDKMPIKVFIKDGSNVQNYDDEYVSFLKKAFDDWAATSEGRVAFSYVDDPTKAQIDCSWTADPKQLAFAGEAGHAGLSSNGHTIDHASIVLLTTRDGRPVPEDVVKVTNLHEIGHALGLQYSPNPSDVMFLAKGPASSLSSRDAKTLVALYAADTARIERKQINASRTIQTGASDTIPVQVARLNSEAVSNIKEKDFSTAENKLKQALRLQPDNDLTNTNLGSVYGNQAILAAQSRDFPRAEQLFQQSLHLFESSRHKDLLMQALRQYAHLLLYEGKAEEAKKMEERAKTLEKAVLPGEACRTLVPRVLCTRVRYG